MAEINLEVGKDAWESQFVPLTGRFQGRYVSYEQGISQSGKPKITFLIDIIAPETVQFEGKEVRVAGRQKIRDILSLSEAASFNLRQRLQVVGVPHRVEPLGGDRFKVSFDPDHFIGREAIFELSQEEDKLTGKTFSRVEKVLPVT